MEVDKKFAADDENDDDQQQQLVMDQSAYEMYHQAQTSSPCLSFDIIKDDLGTNRTEFPHTCFMVSGTQAANALSNHVIVMKMSNLKRTFKVSLYVLSIFIRSIRD